ncbi:hypothetical protein BT96DRAFT_935919 [Gymnopus androsaceus JB14]|uniref:Uncharacterized protein n=1 Tax=Gymnopus androsaceus JB14 TaxID=1447944 RepID=A0A6A4I1D3_9AGAR|nr:hypothetical protein BT96DRAFT_935919 [Gymnopus androsaceus JB14]
MYHSLFCKSTTLFGITNSWRVHTDSPTLVIAYPWENLVFTWSRTANHDGDFAPMEAISSLSLELDSVLTSESLKVFREALSMLFVAGEETTLAEEVEFEILALLEDGGILVELLAQLGKLKKSMMAAATASFGHEFTTLKQDAGRQLHEEYSRKLQPIPNNLVECCNQIQTATRETTQIAAKNATEATHIREDMAILVEHGIIPLPPAGLDLFPSNLEESIWQCQGGRDSRRIAWRTIYVQENAGVMIKCKVG